MPNKYQTYTKDYLTYIYYYYNLFRVTYTAALITRVISRTCRTFPNTNCYIENKFSNNSCIAL